MGADQQGTGRIARRAHLQAIDLCRGEDAAVVGGNASSREFRGDLGTDPRHIWIVADAYLDSLRRDRDLSPFTVRNYAQDLYDFCRFLEAREAGFADVTVQTYRAHIAELRDGGMSLRSTTRRGASLKSFFRYLCVRGVVAEDPLQDVTISRKPRKSSDILTLEGVEALLDQPDRGTATGLRDRALLEVLYGTGLRVGDIVALRTSMIDWQRSTVALMGRHGRPQKRRLSTRALAAVQAYVLRGRPALQGQGATDHLWLNRNGRSLSVRAVQLAVRRYGARARLPAKVTPEVLRRSFASHLFERGADVQTVQRMLGHAARRTTRAYTHAPVPRGSATRRAPVPAGPASADLDLQLAMPLVS